MGKRIEVPKCLHPIDQAFDQPREDGSGSVDKICGVCGFTMCEVLSPVSEGAEVVEEQEPVVPVKVEPEGTADEDGMADGDPTEGPEGSQEPVPVGGDQVTTPFTSDGNQPTSYVTRDPDKVSAPFTRELPVPVPDEELAELAKRMSHTHGIWCKAKLDAKAAAKGFKGITDRAEDEMVEIAAIIEAGTEQRPVQCRWEFDYAAGVKKLRRLDNWQISDEETLTGDELHLSFDFQKQSEDNVAKFFERRDEGQASPTDTPPLEGETAANSHDAAIVDINAEAEVEDLQRDPAPEAEPTKEASPYLCKICDTDAGSHTYLVRHLRDVHSMKLSEYKLQFPAEA